MKLFSPLPRRLSHFACNSPPCRRGVESFDGMARDGPSVLFPLARGEGIRHLFPP